MYIKYSRGPKNQNMTCRTILFMQLQGIDSNLHTTAHWAKMGVTWTYKCANSSVFELEKCYLHQNWVEFDEKLYGMPYYDLWTRF